MIKDKILLAGATGYLGKYITQELLSINFKTKIIVRDKNKVKHNNANLEIKEAEVTKPETLKNIFDDIRIAKKMD